MKDLVSPFQSSFIPGRGTIDNILLLQEVMTVFHKKKGKKGGIVMKIDLTKAYDRIPWDFFGESVE